MDEEDALDPLKIVELRRRAQAEAERAAVVDSRSTPVVARAPPPPLSPRRAGRSPTRRDLDRGTFKAASNGDLAVLKMVQSRAQAYAEEEAEDVTEEVTDSCGADCQDTSAMFRSEQDAKVRNAAEASCLTRPGAYAGALGQNFERNDSTRHTESNAQERDIEAIGDWRNVSVGDLEQTREASVRGISEVPREKLSRKTLFFGALVCVLLAALIVAIPVAVASKAKSNEVLDPPIIMPTNTSIENSAVEVLPRPAGFNIESFLLSILPNATAQAILEEPKLPPPTFLGERPHFNAWTWMLEDPMLRNYSTTRLVQRFAMVTLFYGTSGPGWTRNGTWASYEWHECNWQKGSTRIACDGAADNDDYTVGEVTKLRLLRNGLASPGLPPELGLLTMLNELLLNDNGIQGALPSEIGKLTLLSNLNVAECSLSRPLPSEIGALSLLTNLELRDNAFLGSLPSEIGALTGLSDFTLTDNLFTGILPSEIGLLTSLTALTLYGVDTYGPTPTVKKKNKFDGTLPSELGTLSALTKLSLSYNNFSGSVPDSMKHLASLEILELAFNGFTGTIPVELPSLVFLFAQSNLFQGNLPTEVGLLTDLRGIWVSGNSLITGTVPSELGLLTEIQYIALSSTALNGTLPTELDALTGIASFNVFATQLSGTVPAFLCTELQEYDSRLCNDLCGCHCACPPN